MAVNKTERVVLAGEVRDIYEAYQHRKGQIERIIREKIEREIAAEQGDALRDLSKALHEYHRKGLPKSALRVATKKYGNNEEFLKLWNAYTPEDTFTLAVGRSTAPVFEWVDKVLYVRKNPTNGETLSNVLAFPLYDKAAAYYGTFRSIEPQVIELIGDYQAFLTVNLAINAEVKRAFSEGEITESTHPFDYVNDLPEDDRDKYLRHQDQRNFDLNDWIVE